MLWKSKIYNSSEACAGVTGTLGPVTYKKEKKKRDKLHLFLEMSLLYQHESMTTKLGQSNAESS